MEPSGPQECRWCGASSTATSTRFRGGWPTRDCLACGTSYVDPMPSPEDLARLYRYESYGQPIYDLDERKQRRRRSGFARRLAEAAAHGLPKGRLLDVGCSTGSLLVAAASLGWEPEGIEVDAATARVARERSGAPVRVGSGLEVLDESERFDAITMSHWLEHAPDPRGQMIAAERHLAPGGGVYVRVPNAEGTVATMLGARWRWYSPPVHLIYFGIPSFRHPDPRLALRPVWASSRQGDAYPILVELALGAARRPPSSPAGGEKPCGSSGPVRGGPLRRMALRLVEDSGRWNPLAPWEDSELSLVLRRPAASSDRAEPPGR
jgi:SAM-dependent methyltransferase